MNRGRTATPALPRPRATRVTQSLARTRSRLKVRISLSRRLLLRVDGLSKQKLGRHSYVSESVSQKARVVVIGRDPLTTRRRSSLREGGPARTSPNCGALVPLPVASGASLGPGASLGTLARRPVASETFLALPALEQRRLAARPRPLNVLDGCEVVTTPLRCATPSRPGGSTVSAHAQAGVASDAWLHPSTPFNPLLISSRGGRSFLAMGSTSSSARPAEPENTSAGCSALRAATAGPSNCAAIPNGKAPSSSRTR